VFGQHPKTGGGKRSEIMSIKNSVAASLCGVGDDGCPVIPEGYFIEVTLFIEANDRKESPPDASSKAAIWVANQLEKQAKEASKSLLKEAAKRYGVKMKFQIAHFGCP